jgi:putative ABC transport system ATP-binding protein
MIKYRGSEPLRKKGTFVLEMAEPIIDIKDLNVTYFLGRSNEVQALKNINLTVFPGEFVVLFGPSGCGKSTLLYSIGGLERRATGEVLIEGRNVPDMGLAEIEEYRQETISFIFQAFYLINSLEVIKNITLPQTAIGVDVAVREEKARKLMDHFGVSEQADKVPAELSGGQQQRVAICRALINDADILLADEPVGNLDSHSAEEVLDLLIDLNRRTKKTIVLVTHNPAYLHIAHRVYYMRDGEIVETKVNSHLSFAKKDDEPVVEGERPSRDIELLARTFSSLEGGQDQALIAALKAKEIVAEALTGFTTEEIATIEDRIKNMLQEGLEGGPEKLEMYLDKPVREGGLGLDKRRAEKMTDRMVGIIDEMRLVRDLGKGQIPHEKEKDTVEELRSYLLEHFNVSLKDPKAVVVLDKTIRRRIHNDIGRKELQEILDRPQTGGGAGLNRGVARKIAKHLELVLLGKI